MLETAVSTSLRRFCKPTKQENSFFALPVFDGNKIKEESSHKTQQTHLMNMASLACHDLKESAMILNSRNKMMIEKFKSEQKAIKAKENEIDKLIDYCKQWKEVKAQYEEVRTGHNDFNLNSICKPENGDKVTYTDKEEKIRESQLKKLNFCADEMKKHEDCIRRYQEKLAASSFHKQSVFSEKLENILAQDDYNVMLNKLNEEIVDMLDRKKLNAELLKARADNKKNDFKLWLCYRESAKKSMHERRKKEYENIRPFAEDADKRRNAMIEWGYNTFTSSVAVTLNTNLSEEDGVFSFPSLKKKLGKVMGVYRNISLGAKRGKLHFIGSVEKLENLPHFHLVLQSPVFKQVNLELLYNEEKKLELAWKSVFPGGTVFMDEITDSRKWLGYIFKHKESLDDTLIIDDEMNDKKLNNGNSIAPSYVKPIRVLTNSETDKRGFSMLNS